MKTQTKFLLVACLFAAEGTATGFALEGVPDTVAGHSEKGSRLEVRRMTPEAAGILDRN